MESASSFRTVLWIRCGVREGAVTLSWMTKGGKGGYDDDDDYDDLPPKKSSKKSKFEDDDDDFAPKKS